VNKDSHGVDWFADAVLTTIHLTIPRPRRAATGHTDTSLRKLEKKQKKKEDSSAPVAEAAAAAAAPKAEAKYQPEEDEADLFYQPIDDEQVEGYMAAERPTSYTDDQLYQDLDTPWIVDAIKVFFNINNINLYVSMWVRF